MNGISSSLLWKCVRRARVYALPLSLVLLLLFSGLAPASRAQLQDSWGQPDLGQKRAPAEFVPGEVIVRFRSEEAAEWSESEPGAELAVGRRRVPMRTERFDGAEIVRGLRIVRVPADDTLGAIEALKRRADVLYAEPNYVRRKLATANDPRFGELWGLKNTGLRPASNGVSGKVGADIEAESAWGLTTGSRGVVVGVVDEGVDITHPDLAANVWKNPGEVANNGIDDDANGFIDDTNGWDFFHDDRTVFDGSGAYPSDDTDAHGTHVAGTIGAVGDNGVGVTGVNWQVSLMSLKVLGRDGEGMAPSSVLMTVRAYNYAKMMRDKWASSGGAKGANIRVLNNSYGGAGRSQAELDAINALNASGILFVVAAGNNSLNNDAVAVYPANYNAPNVLSVGATDSADSRTYFSNYGPRTVGMAAPGDLILSTTPNGTYSFFSGTSMASPHVAGAAALVCAVNPNITVKRLRSALMYSGDVLGTPTDRYYTLDSISGRRLNALRALQNASEKDTTAPATVGGLQARAVTGRQFTLNWTAPGDDGSTGRAAVYEVRFSDTQPATAAQFEQARPLLAPFPDPAGSAEQFDVEIPYRHRTGFISVRALDNVGNAGPITSVPVSVTEEASDPYVVTLAAAQPLSTGGTRLNVKGDDINKEYSLPWYGTYFGKQVFSVRASTNGVLYVQDGPRLNDAGSTVAGLNSYRMIAGLWDDLRTDRRSTDDIYVVKPDADRVIFRWQAVTFDTPISATSTRGENPVSFEIELNRNGTIKLRYGAAGNQKLWPVVGVSDGSPDPYDIATHTSENSLKSLAGAQTVIFTPYKVTHQPPATVTSLAVAPTAVVAGKTAKGTVTIGAFAPIGGAVVNLSDDLAATTLPATVTVPEGQKQATFTITTAQPITAAQTGTITAKAGSSAATAPFTVNPVMPLTLTLTPNLVSGGSNVSGSVTLNGPAPAGGAVVALSDNLAATTVPAGVTVPAGATKANFTIKTSVVTAKQSGSVVASYNGAKSAALSVRPVGVLSVAVNPNPVVGGVSMTGTVTLERASTANITVALGDNVTATTFPTSLVIPARTTSKTFTVTTATVSDYQSGTLRATANGVTKTTTFLVNPASAAVCAEPNFKLAAKSADGVGFPFSVAAGDFNLDGKADLAVSAAPYAAVRVAIGNGLGGFGVPVSYIAAEDPANYWGRSEDVVVGDFNRDGKPDLVATSDANSVAVLLGDGAGGFGAPTHFSTGQKPRSIVAGDFNRDGKPDVAVTTSGYVSVLLGNGAGGFAAPKLTRVGAGGEGLVAADFNGDGKLDVATSSLSSGEVTVSMGNGLGGFGAPFSNPAGLSSYLTAGDFNGDGKLDLALRPDYSDAITILLGNGTGSFAADQRILGATYYSPALVTADLNGDARDDLVTQVDGSMMVFYGSGPGGLKPAKSYLVEPKNLTVFTVGDFNGDGRPDFGAVTADGYRLSVMLNSCS